MQKIDVFMNILSQFDINRLTDLLTGLTLNCRNTSNLYKEFILQLYSFDLQIKPTILELAVDIDGLGSLLLRLALR